MQTSFRTPLLVLVIVVLTSACYAHRGKPYEADEQAWLDLAEEACQRRDQRACEALVERAGRSDPRRICDCSPGAQSHDTSFDDER